MTPSDTAGPDIESRRRARVPTVIQMENAECGAAALAMILAYHGRQVPLSVLREQTNVSRDGASAGQLARVARQYGLTPHAFSSELTSLPRLSTPFIAYWGFNHFVVIEGWDHHHVFINDPASGPRKVTWEQMDKDFTGVALTFEGAETFTAGGRPPSPFTHLPRLLTGHTWPLIFAGILGVFYAIPGIAAAGFLSFFINTILANQQTELVAPFFLAVAVTLVVLIGLGWIQSVTLVETTASLSTSLAARLSWRMLRLPMRYFTQRSAGEIAWRLDIPDAMSQQLSGPLPVALASSVSVVVYFVVMLLVCVPVALAALAIALLNVVALRVMSRREREGRQALMQDEGKMHGEVISGISSIEFVKATGSEDESFNRLTGLHASLLNKRQSLTTITQVLGAVPGFLSIIASALAIGIGAFAVLRGSLSIGALVALQVLVAGFLAPFASFVRLSSAMNEVSGDLAKIDDVLEQAPESSGIRTRDVDAKQTDNGTQTNDAASVKLTGRIEFRDVVFGYNRGAAPLLNGLSFVVHPGHRIAFVGTSGAGKSTVARLITGLEHPWSGEILIDGIPREDLDPAALSASLAFVDQTIVLFPGSIIDNLTLWDSSIDRERVVAAARDAAIHDAIAARPGGYEAKVEEGARNFSGGQAQRMEIARALSLDPTILVLDEATSALDATTELDIDNAIRRRGCTTVVVAHRMSTIRDADLILVLDHGAVAHSGTHDDLMAADGLYRSLVQS